MQIPTIKGVIERRILVNYRIDAAILARQLPAPFRPQLHNGFAIGGICLIRLAHLRPWFMPFEWGGSSENAAHRIAVEWDQDGQTQQGVYIPRRDTNSRFNVLTGGRIFPGVHHLAEFKVNESAESCSVAVASRDHHVRVEVSGHVHDQLPKSSIFATVDEVSAFFERGSVGYSPNHNGQCFEGLELSCQNWSVTPLAIDDIQSSYFEDPSQFPAGSVNFDCALLMSHIQHEWRSRTAIPVGQTAACLRSSG